MKIKYRFFFISLFITFFSICGIAQQTNLNKMQEELQSAEKTRVQSQKIVIAPSLTAGGGILLLEDNYVENADTVEAMLINLGFTYTRSTSAAFIAAPVTDWLSYDAVIWVGTTSEGAELDSATAYLAAGGNFINAENDAAYFFGGRSGSLLAPLFEDYFQAEYVSDEGSDGIITGADIMSGIMLDIVDDPYPDDVILTGPNATGLFLAPGDTTWAALRAEGTTGRGISYRAGLFLWDPQFGDHSTNTAIYEKMIDFVAYGVVPVELVSFSASIVNQDVSLSWITATETNNSGFNIERKAANNSWEKIAFVSGFGTTAEMKSYSFVDSKLEPGSYTYRLKQIDFNGTYEYSKEIFVDVTGPVEYTLKQNYPNPFNPNTTINYTVAKDGFINIAVFNLLGEKVATLVNTNQKAGRYDVKFDASRLSSGIYFYSIEAGDFKDVKKMTLLK